MNAKTEVVESESKEISLELTPMQLLTIAVEQNIDTDKIEKLMDLQERYENRLASKEFDDALAKFQAQCEPIPRVKKADRYYYAPLEKVMETIRPALETNGLSIRFSTNFSDGYITAFCTVAHTSGHKETSEFSCPVDTEAKTKQGKLLMNVSQQQGSANSYAKRYALSNALNLVYCDEDDDGQSAGVEYIDDEQVRNLESLLTEVKADKKVFLKWAKAESLEAISTGKYDRCIRRLEDKR